MHTITPSFVGFAKAPWNKGRLIGQKRPLRPREVWAIRVRLQLEKRKRDLALFNLAIDSKLRGCDLVQLRVNDVCLGGRVQDRATIIQRKTGRPVQFEITEQTRAAIRDRLADTAPGNSQYLFPSRFHDQPHLSDAAVRSHRPSLGRMRGSIARHMERTRCGGQRWRRFTRRPSNLRAVQLLLGTYEARKYRPLSRHRG